MPWCPPLARVAAHPFLSGRRFREEHGHADVPLVSKTTGTVDPLGAWVKRQRRSYREGKLAPERRDSLQLIDGFAWVGKSCRAQGSSSGKEARRIQTELHDDTRRGAVTDHVLSRRDEGKTVEIDCGEASGMVPAVLKTHVKGEVFIVRFLSDQHELEANLEGIAYRFTGESKVQDAGPQHESSQQLQPKTGARTGRKEQMVPYSIFLSDIDALVSNNHHAPAFGAEDNECRQAKKKRPRQRGDTGTQLARLGGDLSKADSVL